MKDLCLEIACEYTSYNELEEIVDFVYDDFSEEIYRQLNIKTKCDLIYLIDNGNERESENATNTLTDLVSQKLLNFSKEDLIAFAKLHYDSDFSLDNIKTEKEEVVDVENKVFKSKNNKKPMTFIQLCEFQYKAGYSEKQVSFWTMDRIAGTHCNCGNGKGEFVLLKINCKANKESGKLYMKCRVCSNYSHL